MIFLIIFLIIFSICKYYIVYDNISVVICNYDRPENVQHIINKLKYVNEINQIIITHGKPDTFKNFENCINIKNYKINNLYGSAQRYFTIDYIKNDIVLFIDDDHLPSYNLIYNLLFQMQKDHLLFR